MALIGTTEALLRIVARTFGMYGQGTDPLPGVEHLRSPAGKVVEFTARGEDALSVEKTGGNLHISIQDTGIGMIQEEIGRLCMPFQLVDGNHPWSGRTGPRPARSHRLTSRLDIPITAVGEKGRGRTVATEGPVLTEDHHG